MMVQRSCECRGVVRLAVYGTVLYIVAEARSFIQTGVGGGVQEKKQKGSRRLHVLNMQPLRCYLHTVALSQVGVSQLGWMKGVFWF